ncbi:carbon-nitrogen hydrolase [Mycena albidolilacea]|uniref:Carbon-nitrogen hydrolase n=1 Tax=Mycena albidolilacea TaxID=1033008 RepID=A0AAD7AS29_9AGAR|nr:carbon-nitrogen hydrolase [Mycena albidolilacea]
MDTSKVRIKAAAVHAAPVYMDKKATTQKVIDLIRQAKSKDITLLVFPETFIPGYPYFIECYPPLKQVSAIAQYAEQSVVTQGSEIVEICAACRDSGVAISLGVSERVAGGYTLFNSQVNIDTDGRILGIHRKLQPTYVERAVWAQGSGATLKTYRYRDGYNMGGLCCWENCMQLARQALAEQNEHIHAAAWPALNTMAGFEGIANSQIEALMKSHALMCQTFVICASNYVDETCLVWMENNLGQQDLVKRGGGWSSIIHPFCELLAGPQTGETECLVDAEINLGELAVVKVWIDAAGHYKRPEVLGLTVDKKPLWRDDPEQAGPSTARKIPFWDEHGQAKTILLESAGGTEIKLNNFKQAQNSVSDVGNSHSDDRTSGERESAE